MPKLTRWQSYAKEAMSKKHEQYAEQQQERLSKVGPFLAHIWNILDPRDRKEEMREVSRSWLMMPPSQRKEYGARCQRT